MITAFPGGRGFRLWLAGATASGLGDSVTFFTIAWVAASHGAGVASLVLTIESIPLCLLILLGGALADRWGIRRMMIGCDGFMALVMACFVLAALVETPMPVGVLITVAFLSGVAAGLRRPAAMVFPRMFATGNELSRGMATATLFQQVAQIAGKPIGGVLLAAGGLALTSGLDATSFVVIMVVLIAVRPPLEPPSSPGHAGSVVRQLADAARAARATPGAVAAIWTVVGLAVTILPLVSLCAPLIGHQRGWGPGGTGFVTAGWVVGGMGVMAGVARRGMPGRQLSLAGPVVAAGGVVMLAVSTSEVVAVAALTLVGVGTSLLTTRLFPRFMDATPPEMLARFSSLLGLAQTGPLLVVTPLTGVAIATLGMTVVLAIIGLVLLLTLAAAIVVEKQHSNDAKPRDAHAVA